MSEIRLSDWEKDRDVLCSIRRRVFIEEQDVPEELEWDEHDASCTHFVALVDGLPVATARLKPDGQIGRMAVLKGYRRQGIGTEILEHILRYAEEHYMHHLFLHAQVYIKDFYRRHGFVEDGDEFLEADIPHQSMYRGELRG